TPRPTAALAHARPVPSTADVDPRLAPGEKATCTVAGLGGASLPSLPNSLGILAEGPKLAYDSRSGNIRLSQGEVQAGLQYTVTAAALPTVDELAGVTASTPPELEPYTRIGAPPEAVRSLLQDAATRYHDRWTRLNYGRT